MFQENSTETCILSRVKQITSPGWVHERSARTWCTGKTQRDQVEREVGGGIGMGNTCKPMVVSFQCMTKSTTIKKKNKKKRKTHKMYKSTNTHTQKIIRLSRKRTEVGALLWEDPTCLGATPEGHRLQSPCSATREATAMRSRSAGTREEPPLTVATESPHAPTETPRSQNKHISECYLL